MLYAIHEHYKVSIDWERQQYCGISIKQNYHKYVVDLSMPGYIQAALHRLQNSPPSRKEHAPHIWERPIYGATQKVTNAEDTSQKLPPERILRLKQTTGTLLFYDKAMDLPILASLGTIASLDYCDTHPNATLRYKASWMVLKSHIDASYLLKSLSRSRSGGFTYMRGKNEDNNRQNGEIRSSRPSRAT